MGLIRRDAEKFIRAVAREYAVVAVLGPRQSGKTTLVRSMFPDYDYVNFENPDERNAALADGASFLARYRRPLILDEVQRVPELLSRIQVLVDESPRKKGRFVLTGSHQPALRESISQSLAGRIAICTLLPLSISELMRAGVRLSREQFVYNGFMPRLYGEKATVDWLYSNYEATYVERDVSQIIRLKDRRVFENFLRLVAGRVGQLVNYDSLACELGVSAVTVKSWFSILEASYITFTLPCYYKNWGKRFVKTPKVYFTDVGLAAHLLGIRRVEDVDRDPLFGGLFENMVIADILKNRLNRGLQPDLYFMRTSKGVEIDLVMENARRLDLYEIKSSASFSADFAKNISLLADIIPEVGRKTVVYSGRGATVNGVEFVNFAAVK